MTSLNRASLIGHVGARPEIRATQDGRRVASFSIATGEQWTDRASNEKRERTEWHRIVVFAGCDSDGLVGIVERYVDKGKRLFVEGQLRTRKWTGQDNIERYSTEIVLSGFGAQLILLDGGGGNRAPAAEPSDYGGGPGYSARHDNPGAVRPGSGPGSDLNDEIPF